MKADVRILGIRSVPRGAGFVFDVFLTTNQTVRVTADTLFSYASFQRKILAKTGLFFRVIGGRREWKNVVELALKVGRGEPIAGERYSVAGYSLEIIEKHDEVIQ